MCGVVGIVGKSDVNLKLYDALTVLQHRGQDAAGIMTCEGDRLSQRKDVGLVRDVWMFCRTPCELCRTISACRGEFYRH